MDPLSIICGTLACIQCASKSFDVIRTFRHAPQDLAELKHELAVLTDTLDDVALTLRESSKDASDRYSKLLVGPLRDIKKDVAELKTYLEKNLTLHRFHTLDRVLWTKEQPRIKDFNEKLNRRKMNLHLAIAAAGM